MFRWAGLTHLAGGKFLVLSVGEGPINASLSRFFPDLAFSLDVTRSDGWRSGETVGSEER